MCTGGRIVDHLEHGLEDPANDIFFVGYQAKGTPGRRTPHLVPYTLNLKPCEAFHAHAARGNPAGSWGKPRPPCPCPSLGSVTLPPDNDNKRSLTPCRYMESRYPVSPGSPSQNTRNSSTGKLKTQNSKPKTAFPMPKARKALSQALGL